VLIVTGATGLLGNTVLRQALAQGVEAAALVRPTSPHLPLNGLESRRIEADLAETSLNPLLQGASVVVHCAARVGIGRTGMAAFRRDNALATARLAAACRAVGARLVHVSTVDTLVWGTREAPGEGEPAPPHALDTAYAASKREAEETVRAEIDRGLDAVIVHPGFLLGPWDWKPSSGRLMLAACRGPMSAAPPGGNDFCHAGDVAAAMLTAARIAPTGSRYVLSGEALTYSQAFRQMRQVANRSGPVLTAPAALVMAAGHAGDLLGRLTGREPALNSAAAAASCSPHHFSSAKAMRDLGYSPRPAAEAFRDAWTWFRERGYA
jgi:dihydroflavonol-4-reductase